MMDSMPEFETSDSRAAGRRSPRRMAVAALGVLAAALGAVGVFVPGLPTTIFLIVASYCFARSFPRLEQRLLRLPLFAPYMRFIDEGRPMSARARILSMAAMWTSVALSLTWLRASGRLSAFLSGVIVGVALMGTVAILRFRRAPRLPAAAPEAGSS
jgi:hypothetical protein